MSEFTSESTRAQLDNALMGRQDVIRGSGAATTAGFTDETALAGRTLGPGTYKFRIPVAGNEKVVVILKATTVTGSVTARVYTPLADGMTENVNVSATSLSLSAGTQTDDAIDVAGERVKVLEIVVAAAGAVLFAIAEYRAYDAAAAGGGGGGGGAVTVANAADVAQGSTTDAAVVTDVNGTLSGKLRGLVKMFAAVIDLVNGVLHTNTARVGGTAIDTGAGNKSAGTQRVVIATDQTAIPVTVSDGSGALTVDGTVATTAADGTSVTIGALADAAVITSASGSLSAKLRGLVAIFADVWDSTNHYLHINVARLGAIAINLGAGTVGTGTARVTLGSDQTELTNHFGEVHVNATVVSANFNRPNDTNVYAIGDLVANNVTAGSVTSLQWTAARAATNSFWVRRARLKKSGTTITLGVFRLHLYGVAPTPSNGDNGVYLTTHASYLGSIDLDMTSTSGRVFTDAAWVSASRGFGSEILVKLASGSTLFGLLEARAAYVPASGETFTVELELARN